MKRPSARYCPRGLALKVQIVRLLRTCGSLYPAQAARLLGCSADSAKHHMDMMEVHGLLVSRKGWDDCRVRYFRLRT